MKRGTVQVIFSRSANLGSLALRTYLWDAWSHCGIIDGDDVIEATMFKGVDTRTVQAFKEDASTWEIIEIPSDDPAAVIRAARARIGMRYDWLGIVALWLRIDLQRDAMDFCSELVSKAFADAGTPLFRVKASRITPRDLYIRTY